MTTIVSYSFEGAGLALSTTGAITTNANSIAWDEGEKTRFRSAVRRWELYGDFLGVEVPATGVAANNNILQVPVTAGGVLPTVTPPNVKCRAYYGPFDTNTQGGGIVGVTIQQNGYADSGPGQGSAYHGIIQFESVNMVSLDADEKFVTYMHELGHGVAGCGRGHSSNPAAIMYYSIGAYTGNGYPIASEQAACAAMYGAPQTWSSKLAQGALIGNIWTSIKGGYNREPTASELEFWNRQIMAGEENVLSIQGLGTLIFTASTNYEFVVACYERMLGRSPSNAEISYWVNFLNSSSRTYVFNQFVISAEATSYRISTLAAGCWLS